MKPVINKSTSNSIIFPLGFGWSTGSVKSKRTQRKSIKENKIQ